MRTRRAVQRRAALRSDRRRQRRRRLARLLLVAIAALFLPAAASAEDPAPAPEPKYSWGSWTWSQTLVKPGADRHVLFGARYAGKLRLPYGVRLIGRADASAIQDGAAIDAPNSVNITDPATFQTLELYVGAYRPIRGALAAAAIYGACFDVEGGRLKAVKRYPRSWGVGVIARTPTAWASVLFGEHEASGSGFRLLLAGQVPIDDRFSVVGDGAIGGAGTFGRGGLAVKLGGTKPKPKDP